MEQQDSKTRGKITFRPGKNGVMEAVRDGKVIVRRTAPNIES